MSVVIKVSGFRVSVNENDHQPPHVHVRRKGKEIRINLRTLSPMDAHTAFERSDVVKIIDLVEIFQSYLMEKWNEAHPKRQ